MARKKKNKGERPPCPDPDSYIWVDTKEGGYWRRKRRKGAPLNRSFSQNVTATKIVSPVAKRMRSALETYTRKLDTGRLQGRICRLLNKVYKENGEINYSGLKGFDFQEDHRLEDLMLTQYRVQQNSGYSELVIPVKRGAVKQHNSLVTDFYFEGILLYGDAMQEGPLSVEYAVSPPYSFTNTVQESCTLQLPLPPNNIPWMLMLKVSCLEGNEMAAHVKHYGMKVVETGGGFQDG